jgi:hypothetical protein
MGGRICLPACFIHTNTKEFRLNPVLHERDTQYLKFTALCLRTHVCLKNTPSILIAFTCCMFSVL